MKISVPAIIFIVIVAIAVTILATKFLPKLWKKLREKNDEGTSIVIKGKSATPFDDSSSSCKTNESLTIYEVTNPSDKPSLWIFEPTSEKTVVGTFYPFLGLHTASGKKNFVQIEKDNSLKYIPYIPDKLEINNF